MNPHLKKNIKINVVFLILFFLDIIGYFCTDSFSIDYNVICLTVDTTTNILYILMALLVIINILVNINFIRKSNEKFKDFMKNILAPFFIVLFVGISIIKCYDFISNTDTFRVLFSINVNSKDFLSKENRYRIQIAREFGMYSGKSSDNTYVIKYYEIDLEKNIVKKLEDEYDFFKGYKYIGRTLENRTIEKNKADKLKVILNDILNNPSAEKLTDTNNNELTRSIKMFDKYYYLSDKDHSSIRVENREIIGQIDDCIN